MRESNKLTPKKIDALNTVGRYADGGNLYLQVSEIGGRVSKAWIFRFMLGGSARTMGLGSISDFTLAEARNRARKARQLVSDGIDPIDLRDKERDQRRSEREALKAEALTRKTFWQCTDG
jgi:hypothetical protein